ncbi:MAG: 16S rRNA (cytidine(1402)-2'-O)-methyltransferase [Syntrophomonas sp.]|uniref:16S rRNA (cytidine(1402)-2'-O)-methyltransferase n=1 Tax=Syntrophomonas sp. TaxID=2053627 RepID=UPI0026020CBC|nr:16S rRNA (cytidine(1402)-2'-O)-methyltransferase [Syntrophomonas sp.]MDD2510543.1 16S rRNA (cytidine(1402)-2'-O)-methyltransferase [Syntrophomonas sp.]MDD3879037.1 16S rRNA (cytidine(1402)-2'-O)-methyltransferase [Syntrophomonas sp.]MDD4626364.1 16S rRNA (cytidine(1402)-2'-O)-methyltransferase [Syntrophomonas sp.]
MKTGKLYICGTPIGNLEDVSIRLLKTLRKVDLIACEDTRMTIKLLNRYKIKTRMISYHEHSKREKEDYLIDQLLQGQNIALVSDAGMPTISDPGRELIKRSWSAGIELEVIPGPSALTAALALSGMDTSAFLFLGFLSPRRSRRREELGQLQSEKKTIILYEAPHRLRESLADIAEIMGNERKLAIARELTKKHEEIRRGTAGELLEHFSSSPPRGEICLLIAPAKEKPAEKDWDLIIAQTEALISLGMDKKEAFKMKANEYGIKKNELYKIFVGKKQ